MYRELTSRVARMVSSGSCIDSMNWTKSLVSFMCEGSCLTAGWRYVSMNLEMFSVAELQLLTMGLSDMGVLWVFFRKYMCGVLASCGGVRKVYCFLVICLVWCISFSAFLMF